MSSGPGFRSAAAFARALKLLVFGFILVAGLGLGTRISPVPLSWPGRRLRIEQSRTGSAKSQFPNRGALRDRDANTRCQHRLETKRGRGGAGALSAAGRGVVTAPETAAREPPHGERVAAGLTYGGRPTPPPRRVYYHNYS